MKRADNTNDYLCILGGGSVRGFAYIGVHKALCKLGIKPKKYAGSSIGAVYATFLALDLSFEEISVIFEKINFELFRDFNIGFSNNFALSKGEVFLDTLREEIEKAFYKDNYLKGKNKPVTFKDLKNNLLIITTNITDNEPFVFSKEKTPDFEIAQAVRASSSWPGFFIPFEYNGKILADGDLLKGMPCWKLDSLLNPADMNILEFRLEGVINSMPKSFIEFVNSLYSTIVNYSTDFIIDTCSNSEKIDYIKIDTGSLIMFNFSISKEEKDNLIKLGYNCTMDYFLNRLVNKNEKFLSFYSHILDKIKKLEKLLNRNNIKIFKSVLIELYDEILYQKNLISDNLIFELSGIKNIVFSNMKENFFGKEFLNDKEIVISKIQNLKNIIMLKCEKYDNNIFYSKNFSNKR